MIRETTKNDLEQIIDLVSRIYIRPPYLEYLDKEAWIEYIQKNRSLIYEENGKIHAHASLEGNGHFGVLARSFVREGFRNQGIYSNLVASRIKIARQQGLHYLDTYAATYSDVVQRVLIDRFGFFAIGFFPLACDDVSDIGQQESLVKLRKPLLIPDSPPDKREGLFPSIFDGEWHYSQEPSNLDRSKLKIYQPVRSALGL